MGRFPSQERQDGIIADPNAHSSYSKANSNSHKRFKASVPIRVFGIGRRIPKMAPDNDGDIGHKIRCTMDSVRNERLGISENAHNELCHRKGCVPAEPHPSDLADFGTIIFFAHTSHRH